MQHHDTTPINLIGILDQFSELFPISKHGTMQFILIDHSMDEMFLQSMLRQQRELKKNSENSETANIYHSAECGLLELLLSLPEDMRLGQGRWAPIHAHTDPNNIDENSNTGHEEVEGGDEDHKQIDELVHPDDAKDEEDEETIDVDSDEK